MASIEAAPETSRPLGNGLTMRRKPSLTAALASDSTGMSRTHSRNNCDEGKRTAKWLMKQAEKQDQQTVFLLNLLQDLNREIEARDDLMRESSKLVTSLQTENEALRQQLLERERSAAQEPGNSSSTAISRAQNQEQQQREGQAKPNRAAATHTAGRAAEPSRPAASKQPTAASKGCEPPRGGSDGGSDGGVGPRTKCSSLQVAWARMRANVEGDASDSTSHPPSSVSPSLCPAACEAPLSPPTPQPCSPVPAAAHTPDPPPVAAAPCTRQGTATPPGLVADSPAGALALPPPPPPPPKPQQQSHCAQQQPVQQLPRPQRPPPLQPQQEQPQQLLQSPSSPLQQPARQPSKLPPSPPQPPPQQEQPSSEELQRLESRCTRAAAEVASLREQLAGAQRDATAANANFLTTKKDHDILLRKYDSLMLQKLEVEEQRDRLFSPQLDMTLVRQAMPAVDAALKDAEERLAAVVEMLATNQVETDDAARLHATQRRKWIDKVEGLQAKLAAREARVAALEAQLTAAGLQPAAAGGEGRSERRGPRGPSFGF